MCHLLSFPLYLILQTAPPLGLRLEAKDLTKTEEPRHGHGPCASRLEVKVKTIPAQNDIALGLSRTKSFMTPCSLGFRENNSQNPFRKLHTSSSIHHQGALSCACPDMATRASETATRNISNHSLNTCPEKGECIKRVIINTKMTTSKPTLTPNKRHAKSVCLWRKLSKCFWQRAEKISVSGFQWIWNRMKSISSRRLKEWDSVFHKLSLDVRSLNFELRCSPHPSYPQLLTLALELNRTRLDLPPPTPQRNQGQLQHPALCSRPSAPCGRTAPIRHRRFAALP